MKDIRIRELVYIVLIGVLTVVVHTKDYAEQPKPKAEIKPQAVAPEVPRCARHDPSGAPLVSSFSTQAWGEEWVYECHYEQRKGARA